VARAGQPRFQGPYADTRCEPCGKLLFRTRDDAKRAGRAYNPGVHPSAYRCPVVNHMWHWGHLHQDVTRGEVTRDQVYGARGGGGGGRRGRGV